MRDDSTEILFQSFFLQEALVSCFFFFLHRQGCALFDVVHPAFPLQTTALPTLQGALKDGFGVVVVACDIPEPCQFPSLYSCQKRFQWTHKKVDLAQHPFVGLVLRVVDTVICYFVSWCFEPSHPQGIISGLKTKFSLSSGHSFHKSLYHKSLFLKMQHI